MGAAVFLTLWFLSAVWIGATGTFYLATPIEVAITVWIGCILLLAGVWRIGVARAWAMGASVRWLLAPHLVRFVGLAFLVLHARGELPFSVGMVGGIGDVAIAIGASALMLDPDARWIKWWNVAGLVDILSVVVSVFREGLREPQSVAVIREFPLSLLPTFFVPLIIATHGIIFARLRSDRGRREAPMPIPDPQR